MDVVAWLKKIGIKGQTEMFALIGIDNIEYGKRICNPLREDNNPNCRFYIQDSVIYLEDFGSNLFGNVANLYAKLNNIDYHSAAVALKDGKKPSEKNIVLNNPSIKPKAPPTIKYIASTEPEYFKYFEPIKYETLMKYGVMAGITVWIKHASGITEVFRHTEKDPCFIYKDGNNITIYRPYGHSTKKWRKNGNFNYGINQLRDGEPIIVTKSLKDLMVLHDCGFNSYAIPQENVNAAFGDYAIFDNDAAGERMYKKVPNLKPIRITGAKDPFEFVNISNIENLKKYVESCIGKWQKDCI